MNAFLTSVHWAVKTQEKRLLQSYEILWIHWCERNCINKFFKMTFLEYFCRFPEIVERAKFAWSAMLQGVKIKWWFAWAATNWSNIRKLMDWLRKPDIFFRNNLESKSIGFLICKQWDELQVYVFHHNFCYLFMNMSLEKGEQFLLFFLVINNLLPSAVDLKLKIIAKSSEDGATFVLYTKMETRRPYRG